jgi:hypothetical protein
MMHTHKTAFLLLVFHFGIVVSECVNLLYGPTTRSLTDFKECENIDFKQVSITVWLQAVV